MRRAAGVRKRIGREQGEVHRLRGWDDHARPSESHRGGDDLAQWQTTEPSMDVQVSGQVAWHRHRTEAAMECLLGRREVHGDGLEVGDRLARWTAAARRVDEEVEQHLLAVWGDERGGTRRRPGIVKPGSQCAAAKPAATAASNAFPPARSVSAAASATCSWPAAMIPAVTSVPAGPTAAIPGT